MARELGGVISLIQFEAFHKGVLTENNFNLSINGS